MSPKQTMILLGLLSVILILPQASAQTGDHTSSHPQQAADQQVIDKILKATAVYKDIDKAIAAGYRLVGPDFPGMGEHWVNVRRVVQRDLDITNPAVLSYVRVGDSIELTGAAYTWPLQPGEEPPEFIQPGLWHAHSGSIDEETLALNPKGANHGGGDQPRLAMIHAWVWAANPAGTFVQDNWALPFMRLGLPVPDAVPPQAGKALFLLTGGVDYYLGLIELAGSPKDNELRQIREVLEESAGKVKEHRGTIGDVGYLPEDITVLENIWMELWSRIRQKTSPRTWEAIQELAF